MVVNGLMNVKAAAKFIDQVFLSSEFGTNKYLTPEVVTWLQKHCCKPGDYTLFRGIGPSITKKQDKVEWNCIHVNEPVPDKYLYPEQLRHRAVVHTSLSKVQAKYFASGSTAALVFEIEVPSKYVLFDGTMFAKVFTSNDFDEGDYADHVAYFKSSKEVLLLNNYKPISSKVVYHKG